MTVIFGSCGSIKKFDYFQDLHPGDSLPFIQPKVITFEPGDRLSIIVNSKDPKLASLFNLTTATHMVGENTNDFTNTNSQISLYTVDSNGDIDFPVIGKIHVAGQSREETAALIKGLLIGKDLLKDPVVTVEYGNLYYYTLGELGNSAYKIDKDRTTIIEALSKAGGLSNYGIRDSVLVIRNEGGVRRVYNLDLTSYKDVASSPAYYVKQNDVIYAKPNDTKKRQSTANGTTLISPSFWMSVTSLLTSLIVLFAN